MNDRLNLSVIDATKEMFHSTLGWSVESRTPVQRMRTVTGSEAGAVISFAGSPSGAVALKCSRDFAAKITSHMLGYEVDTGSSDVSDAVGEFLNMIVGRVLTLLSREDVFKMSVPKCISEEDYLIHVKAAEGHPVSAMDFQYEEDTLSIEVQVSQ